jgi:hypothetical protein
MPKCRTRLLALNHAVDFFNLAHEIGAAKL